MAISINTGFNMGSGQPIDSRNVISKVDMKSINENVWPEVYYTTCKDDGKLYVFNKANEPNNETGKFRLVIDDALTNVDMQIGADITSTQDVGLLPSGTIIKSTTTVKDILLAILTGSGSKNTTTTDNNSVVSDETKLDGSKVETTSNDTGSYNIITDSDGNMTITSYSMNGTFTSVSAVTNEKEETVVTKISGKKTSTAGNLDINSKTVLTYDKNGDLIKSRLYK